MKEQGTELCDDCMLKIMNEGVSMLTIEEMISQKVQVAGTFAIELAIEGHYVMRKGDQYPFTVKEVDTNGDKEEELEFCLVDENYKTIGYKTFATKELLASDYIIIK